MSWWIYGTLALVLFICMFAATNSAAVLRGSFAHWSKRIPGMKQSSDAFYVAVQAELEQHKIESLEIRRVKINESGIFSAQREYLEISRGEYCFHLCSAPFGDGFFVSWWAGDISDWIKRFCEAIPFIGRYFPKYVWPSTYYKADLALMFQSVVSDSVMAVLDKDINAQSLKALTPEEKKPTMKNFFE
jgi:hypothetical protein